MSRDYKITVMPGDGIGPEVTAEAIKVLEATGLVFEFRHCNVGGMAYIQTGKPLPDYAREACEEADAVLFGAVGHDYAPYGIPRKVLIYLRIEKNAYANVRPLKLYPGVYPPDDHRSQQDVNLVIIRDNAEGFALEHEGFLWEDRGIDKRVITQAGAQRIILFAVTYAMKHGRRKITCIDQSNWLFSDKLFRNAFNLVAERSPRLEADCVSVDVAAMMQARDPRSFDVIVTPDIYGDILSGFVIGQIGGVGLAPSACIGNDFAFFEPIHGTAWDLAGKGVANPIASILSARLMLEWLGREEEAESIDNAVRSVLSESKIRTFDLGGSSSSSQMGDAIAALVGSDPALDAQDQKTVHVDR
ncbi:MAG: isocitrate/isopropylmalate dehydrogenase family protein [Candidatus Bathyarchaeota archaeon]|nr:MAG: isocitrate/isopropylmalate dehydrogenase family protein [Candidatus Bathyarchaeota archaeon]